MGHLRSAAKGGHANRGLVDRLRVCSCARLIDYPSEWASIPCGTSTGRSRKPDRVNAPYGPDRALGCFIGCREITSFGPGHGARVDGVQRASSDLGGPVLPNAVGKAAVLLLENDPSRGL